MAKSDYDEPSLKDAADELMKVPDEEIQKLDVEEKNNRLWPLIYDYAIANEKKYIENYPFLQEHYVGVIASLAIVGGVKRENEDSYPTITAKKQCLVSEIKFKKVVYKDAKELMAAIKNLIMNATIELLKKLKLERYSSGEENEKLLLEKTDDSKFGQEYLTDYHRFAELFSMVLGALKQRCKTILSLLILHGMIPAEIERECGFAVGNIYDAIDRCTEKIHKHAKKSLKYQEYREFFTLSVELNLLRNK